MGKGKVFGLDLKEWTKLGCTEIGRILPQVEGAWRENPEVGWSPSIRLKFKESAWLFASLLVCFWWRTLLILFLGSGAFVQENIVKVAWGRGGKQWHRVLDQVWGAGPRGGTRERKKVRRSQERVCAEVQAELGGAGRPYLMASVFSMTGWHLLSRRSQGWRLRRLMKI